MKMATWGTNYVIKQFWGRPSAQKLMAQDGTPTTKVFKTLPFN